MIPTVQLSFEAGGRRARYVAMLSPLLSALAMFALSTLGTNNRTDISDWGAGYAESQLPSTLAHRRLYHPHNVALFLNCLHMMDHSDTNWDNSLDIGEYKDFSNALAQHLYDKEIGQSLPKDLKSVFTDYAEKTDGKSNQIIDIYGSGPGEGDGVEKIQLRMLDELCNETAVAIDALFKEEHERVDRGNVLGGTEGAEAVQAAHNSNNVSTIVSLVCVCSVVEPITNLFCVFSQASAHHKGRGPQPVAINASFTMTIPENLTIDDLITSLENGEDLGHLGHAFDQFVKSVIKGLGGSVGDDEDGDDLDVDGDDEEEEDDGNSTNTTRWLREARHGLYYDEGMIEVEHHHRRLNIGLSPGSAQIYKFVESACPGAPNTTVLDDIVDTIAELIPFGNNSDVDDEEEEEEPFPGMSRKEIQCVTAMGKYKIIVDEEEEEKEGGLQNIYARAMTATKSAIDGGGLEAELEKEPDVGLFHVEGHGVVEDDDFDPYEEVEGEVEEEDDEGGLRTVDIVLISVGSILILCLCCVLCFVELERKTRPRPGVNN